MDEKLLLRIIGQVRSISRSEERNPAAVRIRSWVEENFTREWSLTEMAKALRISRFYMCHLFKREFGISILEFRNALRLTMAKKLLIGTEEKIGNIAVDCGFGSASYFCELFQASEGMAPGNYRQLHK